MSVASTTATHVCGQYPCLWPVALLPLRMTSNPAYDQYPRYVYVPPPVSVSVTSTLACDQYHCLWPVPLLPLSVASNPAYGQ